jgi:hypothetical protein
MGRKAGQVPAPPFLRFFTSADSRVSSRPPGLRTGVVATSLVSASVLGVAFKRNPEKAGAGDLLIGRSRRDPAPYQHSPDSLGASGMSHGTGWQVEVFGGRNSRARGKVPI